MRVSHTHKDRKKFPQLFFVSETERKMYADPDMEGISWMNPAVHVSRDLLSTAIHEVETLAEWLEERILAARYGRKSPARSRLARKQDSSGLLPLSKSPPGRRSARIGGGFEPSVA